ncbi:MAG: biotin--[acetyl-CoA-carboxylase] ligase, partial [Pyrinomonadaceae bacterium]|nr:biotin--[acetyl-CoA-carboxylase] ligase [Pyrinomonadaceae bacterium]
MQFTILRFDTIGSTNDEAIKQTKFGANEGVCIVAEQQTKGRGRRERIWHSPKNAGLYVSLILRPKLETKFWALITLSAAVAVHDAILETCGLQTDIKWANDVHVNGKKLCGILA